MDNNEKTPAEKMAIAISMLNDSFYQVKSDYESKLTPEQKKEYEKLSEEKGVNKAMCDLKEKMEQLKNIARNPQAQ